MSNFRIKDSDHGLAKRLRELNRKARVSVGMHSEEGAEDHGGMANVDILAIHEFGLGNVPQRSVVRAWFDERQAAVLEQQRAEMRRVAEGKQTLAQAGERLALWCQGDMQARLARRIPPPLAASTIARKGSDVPLIDSGQLRSGLTGKSEIL